MAAVSPPPTVSTSPPSATRPTGDDSKTYACVPCTNRKVKCDKHMPCASCTKSRLQCHFRASPPPQRRKRKLEHVNSALLERIRSHEAVLRNAGIAFHPSADLDDSVATNGDFGAPTPAMPAARHPAENPGIATVEASGDRQPPQPGLSRKRKGLLVPEYGGSRYYEHGLLGALAKDFKQNVADGAARAQSMSASPQDWSGTSQRRASELLAANMLVGGRAAEEPMPPPPSLDAVAKCWSWFLKHVHPLTKVIHAPTMQLCLFDVERASTPAVEALKYAIYACGIMTQTNSDCHISFGEGRLALMGRYQRAAQTALQAAGLPSVPDLDLLRAYCLLITSMLETADPSPLWILMGSAIRIAQAQGVHRDATLLGLTPFETEMRRRLWWYLLTLDGRLGELTGAKSSLPRFMDNAMPLNVDDADLDPAMARAPPERMGATEMTFCLLNYEITRFLHNYDPWTSRLEPVNPNSVARQSLADLESVLEGNFLRFCDPIIGVQLLATVTGRSTICKLNQMAQLRIRPDPDSAQSNTPEPAHPRMRHLEIALRNIEYDNLIHSNRGLSGFLWHVHFFFPWGAPIVILQILASSPRWDEVMQAAWDQMSEFHRHHTEFLDGDNAIHLLIGRMTLNAWASRASYLRSKGLSHDPPDFISNLQTTQDSFWAQQRKDGRVGDAGPPMPNALDHFSYSGRFEDLSVQNWEIFYPTSFNFTEWPDYATGFHQ